MLTSTSPGSTRDAMDAAFDGPDRPLGSVPDEPDGGDPPEGNWPKPPDGAPPKPLPGRGPTAPPGLEGPAAPLKPLTSAARELPMAAPMTPPAVPATSKAATPPRTARTRRARSAEYQAGPGPASGRLAGLPAAAGGTSRGSHLRAARVQADGQD